MDDPKLKAKGKTLVQFYGCAGCHEISGLEDEGRVGTELTNEGSKPIERLDFALLTEDAKRGVLPDGKKSPRGSWYDLKGFFETQAGQSGRLRHRQVQAESAGPSAHAQAERQRRRTSTR